MAMNLQNNGIKIYPVIFAMNLFDIPLSIGPSIISIQLRR